MPLATYRTSAATSQVWPATETLILHLKVNLFLFLHFSVVGSTIWNNLSSDLLLFNQKFCKHHLQTVLFHQSWVGSTSEYGRNLGEVFNKRSE